MIFNLIGNMTEGCGLWRDAQILSHLLTNAGHTTHAVHFLEPHPVKADVNIFLEVIDGALFRWAKVNWAIPNPEWWKDEYTEHIPKLDLIMCKTYDTIRLFSPFSADKVIYTGFESADYHNATIPREKSFLHVAGKSSVKGTEAILLAWAKYKIPYPLTVLSQFNVARYDIKSNVVRPLGHLPESELITLMNSHTYHLCPSKYEGFGHYIHEALGVGALVLTTDAPPMNEINGVAKLIPALVEKRFHLAHFFEVNPTMVAEAVIAAFELPVAAVEEQAMLARTAFEEDRDNFRQIFLEQVCSL